MKRVLVLALYALAFAIPTQAVMADPEDAVVKVHAAVRFPEPGSAVGARPADAECRQRSRHRGQAHSDQRASGRLRFGDLRRGSQGRGETRSQRADGRHRSRPCDSHGEKRPILRQARRVAARRSCRRFRIASPSMASQSAAPGCRSPRGKCRASSMGSMYPHGEPTPMAPAGNPTAWTGTGSAGGAARTLPLDGRGVALFRKWVAARRLGGWARASGRPC